MGTEGYGHRQWRSLRVPSVGILKVTLQSLRDDAQHNVQKFFFSMKTGLGLLRAAALHRKGAAIEQ